MRPRATLSAGCSLPDVPYPSALFPPETIAAVYQHSHGLPRLINTICENALIAAYARQMRSVSPDIIDDIATDFRLGIQTPALEEADSDELDARKAAQTLASTLCSSAVRAEARRRSENARAVTGSRTMSNIFDALQRAEAENAGAGA